MKGSDLLVSALENEGVERIFSVPGEENLDVVELLRRSSIKLIVTRHEQAAAFMAATQGRLTGRPGVCLATLGPGALNLTTGAAFALLGAMPMVMITGQKGILSRKQGRFQVVDIVATMAPLTKMARQIVSPATIPTTVREAFRLAQQERPGPVHLELPEDIAGEEVPEIPLVKLHPIDIPVADSAALDRAADLILKAERPLVMLGAAASRPRLAGPLSDFVRRVRIPFFNTQMGKGSVTGGSGLYMGTAALSERDYVTVTQLSYTFRPRRRRRELRGKQEKFHQSLRALAIRENKIHALDLIGPKLDGTPVYLDVEGLPDRDFYYLIGIRVGTGSGAVQYGFWADNEEKEKCIWNEFLDVISAIPDPQLIHFGSYETVFLKRMRERHGGPLESSSAATAIEHAVNLIPFIFAHIYFPTFSNGLKEIAGYLGFHWPGPLASGLEAVVWRHRWEASGGLREKEALLDYNRKDCEALELVANSIVDLHRAVPANGRLSQNDVILASEMKRESPFPLRFGRNAFAFPELETINRAAYWDYQRERIYVKSRNKSTRKLERHLMPRSVLMPNTTIECPRASSCPACVRCGQLRV